MSVKEKYYSLPKGEFEKYIDRIKNSPDAMHFLEFTNNPYFYYSNKNTKYTLLELNRLQWKFDSIMDSFSDFAKNQILQLFFIDEIEATNKIENIYSTRHDIFYVMNNVSECNDKKIVSITNSYKLLLKSSGQDVNNFEDIRNIYDNLLEKALSEENMPDGKYFRKGHVEIYNGIKPVHTGIDGEEKVERGMKEFLGLYNSKTETYEKMILCHFLIETIHPYYDGNGRLGRYLFSNGIFKSENTLFAFLISKALSDKKDLYYKAFEQARNDKEFGCLNTFVENIANILMEYLEKTINDLKQKKEKIQSINPRIFMTKTEMAVFNIIREATIFSDYGISNDEILLQTGISKRSLIYAMNKFEELNLISSIKLGRKMYHKLSKKSSE